VRDSAHKWQLRILALFAALVVWFFVSLQDRERQSEKQIEANITYNVPRGVILLDPVQKVSIRLRGNANEIRALNPFAVDVLVDVRRTDRGIAEVQLGEDDVLMPRGLALISIEPNTLRLAIDREGTRTVRVAARVTGEPAAGAVVTSIQPFPEAVVVSGPESHIEVLEELQTSPIRLDGHALDFEEAAAVLSPDPLVRIQPGVVTVRIGLRPPGEREEDVPASPPASAPRTRRNPPG
jgi:YbbR domain-containing protein